MRKLKKGYTSRLTNRYIYELKERNTALVDVNKGLDGFLKEEMDASHIKTFAQLKESLEEKLKISLKEFQGLKDQVSTFQDTSAILESKLEKLLALNQALKKRFNNDTKSRIQELENALEVKNQALVQANSKLEEIKKEFAQVLESNEVAKKNLFKRETMISEALHKLSILSESRVQSAAVNSIKDCLLN